MATATQLAWLKTMVVPAQLTQAKWGVPASVTLAQCILESGWGQSQLALLCHNFFGVKAVSGQAYEQFPTREVVKGRSVMELASFAQYACPLDSFDAHAALLAKSSRYAPAMRHTGDPSAFASALRVCGYSTEPGYALSLVELIQEFGLEQYDTLPPDDPAVQEAA